VESPQQNGRVERKHQHILNVGRALLFQSNLPKYFWSYAVLHATYLINRINTPILQGKSPYEILFNTLPDLSIIKVFGSLAYASTLHVNRTKLSPRGRKCIYLGHKQGVKGTILFDLQTKEIFLSRNVTHHDHILPYITQSSIPKWNYYTSSQPSAISPSKLSNPTDSTTTSTFPTNSPSLSIDFLNSDTNTTSDTTTHLDTNITSETTNTPSEISIPNSTDITPVQSPHTRPDRVKHKPSYLSDYVCNSSDSSSQSASSGTLYPISSYHSVAQLSDSHSVFTLSLTQHTEPKTYIEACKSEHWVKAMNSELEALSKTGTWMIVTLPPNVRPIGSKWVYKIKHKADGSIERYKARLVAKGYSQIEGLDYFDTFSPVAKLTTVRVLLALASIKGWYLHQLDVNNAFLHGDLQEDVYMSVPDGV
jgi:hypothetical protein